MAAYVMVMIDVRDQQEYEAYKAPAAQSIAQYGGQYLARGGQSEVLEGEPQANRFVLLEFDSYERAQRWWNSPEYEAAKPLRQRCSTGTLVLVEGR